MNIDEILILEYRGVNAFLNYVKYFEFCASKGTFQTLKAHTPEAYIPNRVVRFGVLFNLLKQITIIGGKRGKMWNHKRTVYFMQIIVSNIVGHYDKVVVYLYSVYLCKNTDTSNYSEKIIL